MEKLMALLSHSNLLPKHRLEIWWRGMDEEGNVFYGMTDEDIVNQVSTCTIINEDDSKCHFVVKVFLTAKILLSLRQWQHNFSC